MAETARERRVVVALVVGTLFALAALTYVLWPLIVAAERASPEPTASRLPDEDAAVSTPHIDVDDSASDDVIEAEIRRIRALTRVCPMCGPRPEPAARYCSRCGRALA